MGCWKKKKIDNRFHQALLKIKSKINFKLSIQNTCNINFSTSTKLLHVFWLAN